MSLRLEDLLASQAKMKLKSGEQVGSMPTSQELSSQIGDTITAAELKQMLSKSVQINMETASNVNTLVAELKTSTEAINEQATTADVPQVIHEQNETLERIEENTSDTVHDPEPLAGEELEREKEKLSLMAAQNDTLERIEENTKNNRDDASNDPSPAPPGIGGGAGFLSTLMGGLLGGMGGGALLSVAKLGFMGLLKASVIPFIALSIGNGLIEGIKEYQKTGDLSEAVIKGLGGFLEVLTLGLIDEDSIRDIKKSFEDFWIKVKEDWDDLLSFSLTDLIKGTPKEDAITESEYHDIVTKEAKSRNVDISDPSLEEFKRKTEKRIDKTLKRGQEVTKDNIKVKTSTNSGWLGDNEIIELNSDTDKVKMVDDEIEHNGRKMILMPKDADAVREAITKQDPATAMKLIKQYEEVNKSEFAAYGMAEVIDAPVPTTASDIETKTHEAESMKSESSPSSSVNISAPTNVNNATQVNNNPPPKPRNESMLDVMYRMSNMGY